MVCVVVYFKGAGKLGEKVVKLKMLAAEVYLTKNVEDTMENGEVYLHPTEISEILIHSTFAKKQQ